jgi:RecJ-like exonuclease
VICQHCNGSGEGRSGWSGEGRCSACRGTGEVPDVCDKCGEETECNDDGLCEACQEQVDEEAQ